MGICVGKKDAAAKAEAKDPAPESKQEKVSDSKKPAEVKTEAKKKMEKSANEKSRVLKMEILRINTLLETK